jgi:hypothetical protein
MAKIETEQIFMIFLFPRPQLQPQAKQIAYLNQHDIIRTTNQSGFIFSNQNQYKISIYGGSAVEK